MLARYFAAIYLIELALWVTAARGAAPDASWPATAAIVVLCALTLRLLVVLAGFAAARVPLIPLREWWAAFVGEYLAILRLYCVDHLFERWRSGRRAQTTPARRTAVILIHGFLCNAGLWRSIRRRLVARVDADFFTLNLEPPFGDIERLTDQLARLVEAVRPDGGPVILVGHSMGGLVARRFALDAPARVAQIITLGTPHYGTRLARLLTGANVRQMRIGSTWLGDLAAREREQPPIAPRAALRSRHDSIVAPQSNARLDGAENAELRGIGHLAMAYSTLCVDWLADRLLACQDASPYHSDAGAPR